MWEFYLCSANGEALADLTTASGKQIKRARNAFAEAQFSISHNDDAAYVLLEAVKNGPLPTLRAWRDNVLRFNGTLAPFSEDLSDTQLLTPTFRSPLGRFAGSGTAGSGIFTGASIFAEAKEQGKIAQSLIELYGGVLATGVEDPTFKVKASGVSYAGLGIGSIATDAVTRTITYRYANVGQAITNLSECLTGFDFDETPVSEGETLARFNTYTSQGTEAGVQFGYGAATLANVSRVTRTRSYPVTIVRLFGANGLKAEVRSESGIEKYGEWLYQDQANDITSQALLTQRAEGLLTGGPIETLAIYPDLGLANCPRPWDDFDLGDTVSFVGSAGAFSEESTPRINEITTVIDENGNETMTIPATAESSLDGPDALHSVVRLQTS